MEFGPDTDTIRQWLEKRQTYRADGGRHRDAGAAAQEAVFVTGTPLPSDARSAAPDVNSAGRSVLDAIGASPAPEPEPTPSSQDDAYRESRSVVEPLGTQAEAAPAVARRTEGSGGRSTDVTFPPRNGIRRALSITLLAVLVATAAAGYLAYAQPSTGTYGVAITLGVLLLAVWAVRAGSTPTEVRIHLGQLEIRQAGHLEVVELSNPHTPVAIIGTPGHRGWLVLVERPGRPLLQVDSSLVEPHAFMDSLLRLRPDLWEWAAANARELIDPRRAA